MSQPRRVSGFTYIRFGFYLQFSAELDFISTNPAPTRTDTEIPFYKVSKLFRGHEYLGLEAGRCHDGIRS